MDFINFFSCLVLFSNVTLLSILVPGGPVENRDFSGLKGFIFWGFNVFLISMGLVSIGNLYFLLQGESLAFIISIVLGGLYLLLALVDLAGIFPKSPTKMSKTLMTMEIVIGMLGVLLIVLSLNQLLNQ
jgi:hypothetical protein